MGIKAFARSIWGFIKNKVTSAGDKGLQEVINGCVSSLSTLTKNIGSGDEVALFNGVLAAFKEMMASEEFEKFCSDHKGAKKGLAGFFAFIKDCLSGIQKIDKDNVDGEDAEKVVKVLYGVKRYGVRGSRVNAFLPPCNDLYGACTGLTGDCNSYFESASSRLESLVVADKDSFCRYIRDIYSDLVNMCRFELSGKGKAAAAWYTKYGEKKNKYETNDTIVKAVLAVCDYKSNRGFVKRFLKFKGKTKWQKLQALVIEAKEYGIDLGVLDDQGNLLVENSTLGLDTPSEEPNPVKLFNEQNKEKVGNSNKNKNKGDIKSNDNNNDAPPNSSYSYMLRAVYPPDDQGKSNIKFDDGQNKRKSNDNNGDNNKKDTENSFSIFENPGDTDPQDNKEKPISIFETPDDTEGDQDKEKFSYNVKNKDKEFIKGSNPYANISLDFKFKGDQDKGGDNKKNEDEENIVFSNLNVSSRPSRGKPEDIQNYSILKLDEKGNIVSGNINEEKFDNNKKKENEEYTTSSIFDDFTPDDNDKDNKKKKKEDVGEEDENNKKKKKENDDDDNENKEKEGED